MMIISLTEWIMCPRHASERSVAGATETLPPSLGEALGTELCLYIPLTSVRRTPWDLRTWARNEPRTWDATLGGNTATWLDGGFERLEE